MPVHTLLACLALAMVPERALPVNPPRAVVGPARPDAAPLDRRRAHRLWRITVILRLDPGAAGQVFATLEQHDRLLAGFRARRTALIQEIQAAAERPTSDAALTARIDRWVHLQEERRALHDGRWRALAPYLTLQQQAQLLLLLPRLDSLP